MHDVIRNHGFVKHPFNETVVSTKINRFGIDERESMASRLHMLNIWQSQIKEVQNLLNYLKFEKSGSVGSATIYCHALWDFCRYSKRTPSDLIMLPRDQIEPMLRQFCRWKRGEAEDSEASVKKGISAVSANRLLNCIKTFFACNGFNRENNTQIRVKLFYCSSRATNASEYVPTLKEALLMGERATNRRNRCIVDVEITSGLRNSALRALRVGDVVEELKAGKTPILVNVLPTWNERIAGACKGSIPYYTFIAKFAAQSIEAMLADRAAVFGSFSNNEPLFASDYNQINFVDRRNKSLTGTQLRNIVHECARAAGIARWKDVHVKSLRKVFDAVLRTPLADGTSMSLKDGEFLMGHILDHSQENYYDRDKPERIKEIYSKLVFEDRSTAHDVELEVMRQVAQTFGVDLTKAEKEKEKEIFRPITRNERQELLRAMVTSKLQGSKKIQAIINLHELEQRLQTGWELVAPLPDSRAVIARYVDAANA